jgi:signal transduction histidine kinase
VESQEHSWARHISPRMPAEVDKAPTGRGSSGTEGQSDLVLFWHRLRALFLALTVASALVLAVDWGSFPLHPLSDWSLNAPLLIAGLALGLLVHACLRIRRRSTKALLPIFLDATAIGLGFTLLQLPAEALVAPFLYVLLSTAMVLPASQTVWMWCYTGLLAALAMAGLLPHQSLGQSPTAAELHVAVWMTIGTFVLLCLAETLALTGAVRRFARAHQGRLVEQSRRKDDFLAGVSHELRTPLAGVLGFASELRDGLDRFTPAEVVEFAGLIAQGCATANNLVEDLLVAARLETGDVGLSPGPTELYSQALKASSDPEIASRTQGKSIAIEGPPTVAWADPNRVHQILRNLLGNAGRYGGNQITIVVGTETNAPKAFLRVMDDGPGVPEQLRKVLFQAYQHGVQEPGRTESVGLGLHISLKLARLMGGDLTYRRQDGTTIFELTLPLPDQTASQGS